MGCVFYAARLIAADISRRTIRAALNRRTAMALYRSARRRDDAALSGKTTVILSRIYSYLSAVSRGLEHKLEEKMKKVDNFHNYV